MSNIKLNTSDVKDSGLNIQELKESQCFGSSEYDKILENNEGALTQAYGNDVNSIFLVAYKSFSPNPSQIEILQSFENSLHYIEQQIDPKRLKFTITKAEDDEICINRKAETSGRVKIIINDDGVIAFSYLPDKYSKNENVLEFYRPKENIDFESLVFRFFRY